MNFKYKTLTQTQLGQLFGVSSHIIGEWLSEVGLRDKETKRPTREAHKGGYCETAPSGPTTYFWTWDAERTVQKLWEAGHRLADDPPDELVHPPALEGPFTIKDRRVLNANGEVVLRAGTNQHAEVVAKILSLADRHGTLGRLLGKPADDGGGGLAFQFM